MMKRFDYKKVLCTLSILVTSILFGQQNKEFQEIKNYYDYQRMMISTEMKKRFDSTDNLLEKQTAKNDFILYMKKIDSLQNYAYVGALVSVKNREDLSKIQQHTNIEKVEIKPKSKMLLDKAAEYPGGINTMRQQVVELFYLDAIETNQKTLKADVRFVVEKDGSVTSVKAIGDNFTFNKQAEIALYRLPDKFSPAMIKGAPVRYMFRLPLVMNFE